MVQRMHRSPAMTTPVELRQVRYFVVVAEELNFGRAAIRLQMSQPPLSRQIRKLERELGLSLFERNTHSVHLTAAGQVFLNESRRTLEQVERSIEMAKRAHRGEMGQLNLGVAPWLETTVCRRLEKHIHKIFPQLEIKHHVIPSDEQVLLVRNGGLDAGFVRLPLAEHDGLTLEFLFRESLVVMLPDASPLAKAKRMHVAELADRNRIVFRKTLNPALYSHVRDLCERNGYHAGRLIPVDTGTELVDSVLKGDGVAIVPASLKRQITSGLHYARVLDSNADTQVGLIYRRENHSTMLHLLRRAIHDVQWSNLN